MDFDLSVRYTKNSLRVDSEEMKAIQACAAENKIVVCLGYSELFGNSTYVGQCTIDSDGKLLMTRRKLKPFHVERSVFGDGDGPSLENVVDTGVGRVGQLSCGVGVARPWTPWLTRPRNISALSSISTPSPRESRSTLQLGRPLCLIREDQRRIPCREKVRLR
jgi:hypothetical protein